MMDFRQKKVFDIPFKDWLPPQDLIFGLIISSLIINMTSLVLPLSILQIYDRIIPNQSYDTLNLLVFAVVVAVILETILKIGRSYVSAWCDARLCYLSSLKAFKHLIRSDIIEYEKEGAGSHIERLNSIDNIKDFFGGQAITSIIDLPFVLLFLIAIAYIDIRLLVIPLFIQVILGICLHLSSKNLHEKLKRRSESSERKLNFVVETLSNIHTIKALGMEPQLIRRYERLQHSSAQDDFSLVLQNAKSLRLTMFAQQINIILIITFGCFFVMQNTLTIGGLTACILLSGRIIQPISVIIHLWSKIQLIKIAQQKNNEIHQLPLECRDNLEKMEKTEGEIELKNVSFRYSDSHPWLLRKASFKIPKNKITLIVNDGISGKSSLLGLIARLLPKSSGNILIDGKDLENFDSSSFRKHVGYLPEDGVLFEGTILENLCMFNIPEHYDYAIELSKKLGLDEIVLQMPEGYQTVIGRTADDIVSKGVKQRILIIRSLIHNPKIILFDESNSALDIKADHLLRDFLKKIKDEKTILMITYRPSFAEIADYVLFVKDNRIIPLQGDDFKQYLL